MTLSLEPYLSLSLYLSNFFFFLLFHCFHTLRFLPFYLSISLSLLQGPFFHPNLHSLLTLLPPPFSFYLKPTWKHFLSYCSSFFHWKFGVCFMKNKYESWLMNLVFSELYCFAICASMVITVPGRCYLGFMWGCHWSSMAEMRKYLPNQQLGQLLLLLLLKHLIFFFFLFFHENVVLILLLVWLGIGFLYGNVYLFMKCLYYLGWGFSLL